MKKSTNNLSKVIIMRDIVSLIPIVTFSDQINFIAIVFLQ